jgi:hypothetical protein
MKVGIIICDKGDRPLFLSKCFQYLERQTFQSYTVRLVNDTMPESFRDKVDITYRYHIGFKDLFENQKCDVVIVMENDDWYSPKYLQTMLTEWEKAGKPDVFGIDRSLYYHISGKFSLFKHPGRSSMNSTLVTRKVLEHKFDYSDPYLDYRIWTNPKFTRKTFTPNGLLVIGIKHGLTQVAGAGHGKDWIKYQHSDTGLKQLEKWIGQDAAFYRIMTVSENYSISKIYYVGDSSPVLSIITRQHGDRRPKGFARNQESVSGLVGRFEQIFIKDKKGLGVGMANHAFMLSVPAISGRWVYCLDDDDAMTLSEIVPEIERIEAEHGPDVIMCRMIIQNGNYGNLYPSPNVWGKKPLIAQIGTGCFIVRKEIFAKFIHHFGHRVCGDFQFINEIFKHNPKVYWLDKVVSSTGGKPSHGKTEIN